MDSENSKLYSETESFWQLKPEVVFAVLAIVFGLTLAIVNAPFQAPDEGAHFMRAYHVSQGNLMTSRRGDSVGGWIPKSVANAPARYEYLIGHPELRLKFEQLTTDLTVSLDQENKAFFDFFTMALYAPIVYFPQAVGIIMARGCGLSPLQMMYIGRISTLLCWIAVLFVAIRIVPLFKWAFVLLALMPRSLFQASSLSADGPTNALSMLLTALMLRAIFTKQLNLGTWEALFILLTSVLLSMAKQVYLPLVGLVLLIPEGRFNGWRNKIIFCGIVLGAAVLASGLWSMAIRDFYRPWKEANAPEQMSLLMARPWIFPVIAVKSFLVTWKSLAFSLVGVLGFLDVWLPKWIYYTYPILLVTAAVFDSTCKKTLGWLPRGWILLICMCIFLLFELSMYLIWTRPGAPLVEGVHGRYFLPLVIPVLLAMFYNRRLNLPETRWWQGVVGVFTLLVLMTSCWVVWVRYYGPAVSPL